MAHTKYTSSRDVGSCAHYPDCAFTTSKRASYYCCLGFVYTQKAVVNIGKLLYLQLLPHSPGSPRETTSDSFTMTDRSVANQELFLPEENQAPSQNQQSGPPPSQPRFYANVNDPSGSSHPPNTDPDTGVPSFNVIPATPSTSRSSTVRTQATEPKTMSGALPDVTEEDNMYDAPSTGPTNPPASSQNYAQPGYALPEMKPEPLSVGAQKPHEEIAPNQYSSGYPSQFSAPDPVAQPPDTQYQPMSMPQEHQQHGTPDTHSFGYGAPVPPPHPPTYDEDQASRTGTDIEQPPKPDTRPPVPDSTGFQHGEPSSSVHPSVHLQSDQDYAMALQLQEEEDGQAPPLPQRPGRQTAPETDRSQPLSSHSMSAEESDHALAMRLQQEEDSNAPALPTRPANLTAPGPKAFTRTPSTDQFLPPPRRQATDFGTDNPSSDPVHYTRDPHKLIAYLVPFPTPHLTNAPADAVPKRFLIYTPPPPPLKAPPEGVKEDRTHKVQRKWQDEVRKAKLSEAKTTSWPGFRAKLTRGVNKAMNYTTTSNIDFLTRVTPSTSPPRTPEPSQGPKGEGEAFHDDDPAHQAHETKKTVGVDEMVFVYSPYMNLTPDAMREEFVNTVLRTKSKAMRDSVIATGLLPISLAVDIVLIAVSGLFEVNAAWAYFNIKGAKTARSVGKRLSSSTTTAENVDPEKPDAEMQKEDKLKLDFKPAARIDVLSHYLVAECHRVNPKYFPEYKTPPTES